MQVSKLKSALVEFCNAATAEERKHGQTLIEERLLHDDKLLMKTKREIYNLTTTSAMIYHAELQLTPFADEEKLHKELMERGMCKIPL